MNLFTKIFKKLLPEKVKKNHILFDNLNLSERDAFIKKLRLVSNLERNLETIRQVYGDSMDLVFRRFKVGSGMIPGAVVYISGLVDSNAIEEILDSITVDPLKIKIPLEHSHNSFQIFYQHLLTNKYIRETRDFMDVINNISLGSAVIFLNGVEKGIVCETKGYKERSISEPDAEQSLRGPRDGFVENLETNISLIRRRIRAPHLWVEQLEIGALSKSTVAIVYIKGLTGEGLIEEVKERLERIEIDNILDTGYLEDYMVDTTFTIFPLINRTERPDKVIASLVEGRVAILADGSPFALIMPVSFNIFLQAPDDYYEAFPLGTFLRLVRFSAFLISIFLPGIYVAILNYHTELIPTPILLRIIASREIVPFPLFYESLFLEAIFEILREAGIRLPKNIGPTISIVGALVLGEAAINAGLVSPPMVLVVSLTAISSFTTPSLTLGIAARLLRFLFILLGAGAGLFGIQFGIIFLIIHLSYLRSFGEPYFQPFGPFILQNIKDSLIKLPWWSLTTRPKLSGHREEQRQPECQEPKPPRKRN